MTPNQKLHFAFLKSLGDVTNFVLSTFLWKYKIWRTVSVGAYPNRLLFKYFCQLKLFNEIRLIEFNEIWELFFIDIKIFLYDLAYQCKLIDTICLRQVLVSTSLFVCVKLLPSKRTTTWDHNETPRYYVSYFNIYHRSLLKIIIILSMFS